MEITLRNFLEQLPNITNDLKNSSFVGFDAEFSAILTRECFKHRLFDTNEERYKKIKNEASKMVMIQVGLTMFRYERSQEKFIGTGYTFYLCPQDFGDVDQSLIFQASTLRFLRKQKFNLNKFAYLGLPYLSKVEEAGIRKHLKNKTMVYTIIQGFTIDEEKELQHHCSTVSQWLTTNSKTDVVEGMKYLDVENPLMRYVVHNELRRRFPAVLTTDSLGNGKKILIYKNKDVEGATSCSLEVLDEKLMKSMLGFSRIMSLLEKYQKPIVGHNIFLDIILLHNQFIGPLPDDYRKFKKNINTIFPLMYDTKFISYQMGKKLTYDEVWKTNVLQDLYEFFYEGKCKKLQRGANEITLSKEFDVMQSYHEAGWDSYCAGYCFIRLGHWAACENIGMKRAVVPTELLAGLSAYCNKVNIIRAAHRFMNLAGEDPPRHAPAWLYVLALREPVIDIGKIATMLSGYGSIDVRAHGTRSALVAAGSEITVNRILKGFRADKEYRISHYNPFRHSVAGRMAFWGGAAILTGSLMVFLVKRKLKA